MRHRTRANPADECAERLYPSVLGARWRFAAQHYCAAGVLRRPGEGGARTRVVRKLQSDASGVSRAAHREHRHRAQHDRSQHADGRSAQAIAIARQELQNRQEELQQTNQELKEKARLLAHQNEEVERKNREVEQARQALEEKAKQLALTSKYKSEFLANMSHELRTPLNSLLILSDQLSKNPDGNLTARQTEFAQTIHSSGNDLLTLINDILDLSKIESGTVVLDIGEVHFSDLHDLVGAHVPPCCRGEERRLPYPRRARSAADDADRYEAVAAGDQEPACRTRSNSRIAARCRSMCEPLAPVGAATTMRSTVGRRVGVFSDRYRHRHSAG